MGTWSWFKANSDKGEKEHLKYKHPVLSATLGRPHPEISCSSCCLNLTLLKLCWPWFWTSTEGS